MIEVQYLQRGNRHTLTCKGHAGYAEYGKDTICAAASILMASAAKMVQHLEDIKRLTYIEVSLNDGDSKIVAESNKMVADVALDYGMYAIIGGFRLLAENFPAYVSYTEDAEYIR